MSSLCIIIKLNIMLFYLTEYSYQPIPIGSNSPPPTEQDYSAVSAREQRDLEQLMGSCDSAVANAEAFASQLAKDLSVLDGVSN